MTREGEVDWLAKLPSEIEKDQIVVVAAEVDGARD